MDVHTSDTSRDDFWRLQEALNELSATQAQHSERIMRLEKRHEDGGKVRSVWGSSSPFPSALGSSHHGRRQNRHDEYMLTSLLESALNPAAEAFRNFDADTPSAMISSLTLDSSDDQRRAAASRANSVRFDESANNHYGPSRSSIDLPMRTGSGLGTHPLSERSLSHRSERGSTSGFGRANSFGLESSRLLGSIHNSPRVSGNPPPGFFVLGPCPSIIRCWLTELFTNNSVLYAAICSGSSVSSISLNLLHNLGLSDSVIEENGIRKVKLLVYLTEAKIQIPSSRAASPALQVPTITTKFLIHDQPSDDRSVQIILGSDVLREHSADILFSQDKIMIYDDDRNQLSVPLVRPENEAVYKNLTTGSRARKSSILADMRSSTTTSEQSTPGVIGRSSRAPSQQLTSPTTAVPLVLPSNNETHRTEETEVVDAEEVETSNTRAGDDSKSTTGSEKSTTTPAPKVNPGVWSSSWRSSASAAPSPESQNNMRSTSTGLYSRPGANRPMKVLRPSAVKGMASATRVSSSSSTIAGGADNGVEISQSGPGVSEQRILSGVVDSKSTSTKPNTVSSGTAFPWLSQGAVRKPTVTK